MTSGWSGPMAEMIFMGWPQPLQIPGSSLNVLAMSFAQPRLRLRMNSESSGAPSVCVEHGDVGCEGMGALEETVEGSGFVAFGGLAIASRGGASTGGCRSQPARLRNVVETAP